MSIHQGVTDGPDSTPIQIRVAKLVTSSPIGISKEIYLEKLSVQIIDLIKYGINIKDIILQKVCIMVITRIAHICPTVCDQFILIPLAKPLLNIDIDENGNESRKRSKNRKRNKSINKNVKGIIDENNDLVESVISTGEDIEITISIFHSVVTLCPLQFPLQRCLQRCNIGKLIVHLCFYLLAEKKDHYLLPIIKEFTFLFFKNSTDINNLAIQLHNIIIFPTKNYYSIESNGKVCIKNKILNFQANKHLMSNENNDIQRKNVRTASDLGDRLGINVNISRGENNLYDKIPIISSPHEIITAINIEKHSKNSQKKFLNDNFDHKIIEKESETKEKEEGNFNGLSNDVNYIMNMAMKAAQSHETILKECSADSDPSGDFSPHTRIVNAMLGQGQGQIREQSGNNDSNSDSNSDINIDSDDEYECNNDDSNCNISMNNSKLPLMPCVGTGHEILEVSLRCKVASELILMFEDSLLSYDEEEKVKKKNEDEKKELLNKENTKSEDFKEEIDEEESLISELFIYSLQSFLGISKKLSIRQDSIKVDVDDDSDVVGIDDMNMIRKSNLENSLSGLILIILQEHIPMEKLLKGGRKNSKNDCPLISISIYY